MSKKQIQHKTRARIARPLLEFVQNLEFAHLPPYIEKNFLFVKFWRVSFVLSIGRCVYLRDMGLAEDAVQETFIKAYDHIDELLSGKIESTKAWLMRIAVNTCKDTLRSSWMRHIDNRQEIEALPLSMASCAEERLALTQAIMALAPKHREIVLLYYYQDMSLRACAQVLGISAPTATRRLQQAQKKLRIQLEERG